MHSNQSPNKKSFAIGEKVKVIADCAFKGRTGIIHTAKGGRWCLYTIRDGNSTLGHFLFADLESQSSVEQITK